MALQDIVKMTAGSKNNNTWGRIPSLRANRNELLDLFTKRCSLWTRFKRFTLEDKFEYLLNNPIDDVFENCYFLSENYKEMKYAEQNFMAQKR